MKTRYIAVLATLACLGFSVPAASRPTNAMANRFRNNKMRVNPNDIAKLTGRMLCIVAMGLMLTGCLILPSVGPIENAEVFASKVRDSLGLGSEPLQDYGRATWFPGADKWFSPDNERVRMTVREEQEGGVLVLLDCRLMFLAWEEDTGRYKVRYEIDYTEASDIRRRVWGASQRLVIEDRNGGANAFAMMSDNGIGYSTARLNRVIEFLRITIPSSDATENTYQGPRSGCTLRHLSSLTSPPWTPGAKLTGLA